MSGPGCFRLDHKIGQIFLEAQIQQKLCLLIQDPLSKAPSWTILSCEYLHRLTLKKLKKIIWISPFHVSPHRAAPPTAYIWIGGYIARFTHSNIFQIRHMQMCAMVVTDIFQIYQVQMCAMVVTHPRLPLLPRPFRPIARQAWPVGKHLLSGWVIIIIIIKMRVRILRKS